MTDETTSPETETEAETLREWYGHAQAAGFVFLRLSEPMAKGPPPTGWPVPGKVWGKDTDAARVVAFRAGDGTKPNLAVGVETGGRGIILDADDGSAVASVAELLDVAGVRTLSQTTPRGVAWFFTLPDGVELPKLNESMVSGVGLLGTRPAGHYQVGPGSVVDGGAYGPKKPPPDDSGGPWFYRPRDVVPVAVMPDSLIEAIRSARAKARGEAPRDTGQEGRARNGAAPMDWDARDYFPPDETLGCRTVEIGIATLRHLVNDQRAGRNESLYRVVCSLIWHGALTEANRAEVEAQLIAVQGELRAGEKRDVTREVPEQIDHAFAFIASQGGPGRSASGDDTGEAGGASRSERPGLGVAPDVATWAKWKAHLEPCPDGRGGYGGPGSPADLARQAPFLRDAIVRDVCTDNADDVLYGLAGLDAVAVLDELQAVQEGDGAAAAVKWLQDRAREREEAQSVLEIDDPLPPPVLRLAGCPGEALARKTVGVLAGEGGLGKSALTRGLALGVAKAKPEATGEVAASPVLWGGLFEAPAGGGPVVFVQWEDTKGRSKFYLERAAVQIFEQAQHPALADVHVLRLKHPIFGVPPGSRARGPACLPAWEDMERAVKRIEPVLTIIDPVLTAYAAESNSGGEVRQFIGALVDFAERRDTAILLVAHTTKAARNADFDWWEPGQVLGSGQWSDGARCVLSLRREKRTEDNLDPGLWLCAAKVNYGPQKLGAKLEAVTLPDNDEAAADYRGTILAFKAAADDGKPWLERHDVDRAVFEAEGEGDDDDGAVRKRSGKGKQGGKRKVTLDDYWAILGLYCAAREERNVPDDVREALGNSPLPRKWFEIGKKLYENRKGNSFQSIAQMIRGQGYQAVMKKYVGAYELTVSGPKG